MPYVWKCDFKVEGVKSGKALEGTSLNFKTIEKPIVPEGIEYETSGSATMESSIELQAEASKIMTDGLEAVFSLINRDYCSVQMQGLDLVNRTKLEEAGVTIGGSAGFVVRVVVIRPLDSPEEVSTLWTRFEKVINLADQDLKERILRPLHWYLRAVRSDAMDRFINAWMTFEILLTFFGQTNGTIAKRLTPFIQKDALPASERAAIVTKYNDFAVNLTRAGICQLDGRKVSEDLKGTISSGASSDEILSRIVFVISAVRNNLFHGDLKDWTEQAKQCNDFLLEINSKVICHQLRQI